MITRIYNGSVGASYGRASRTVVTAWWESGHVLIPAGFLISSWLDNLLSIPDVFQETKRPWFGRSCRTKQRHNSSLHVKLQRECTTAPACAPETRRRAVEKHPTIASNGGARGSRSCFFLITGLRWHETQSPLSTKRWLFRSDSSSRRVVVGVTELRVLPRSLWGLETSPEQPEKGEVSRDHNVLFF